MIIIVWVGVMNSDVEDTYSVRKDRALKKIEGSNNRLSTKHAG